MPLHRLLLPLLLALSPTIALAQPSPAHARAQGRPAERPWLYRGSDLPPDPAWRFGTLPNGVRYAVRRNARPEHQVSIRIRMGVGSLMERPAELGWAHFIEHMLFRGTARYADREARHIWQELGASFGSDTNAFTSIAQTQFVLDLPNADQVKLDRSLEVMADMMETARFDPAAVDAERPIVMAEKERRPELSVQLGEASRRLFYSGLLLGGRDTIGTNETLAAATPDGLRALYRRWYRPERATVIMVGDADPDMMISLVQARFGGWRGDGPAPAEPVYGRPDHPAQRTEALSYPQSPAAATAAWIRPYRPVPDTAAEEQHDFEQALATIIINRRLERHARGESNFVSATLGVSDHPGTAELTQLSVAPKNGHWQAGLAEAFAIVADARRTPPSAAEIARELSNFNTAVQAQVESEPTTLSTAFANQLVRAVDEQEVVTSAAATQALLARLTPRFTPARIAAATEALFQGGPPRLLVLTPIPVAGGAPAVEQALAAAEHAAPLARGGERIVSFDSLPAPATPGTETSRERLDDLDVTIVRFANGSTLTFKPTRFDQGRVFVQLRFGDGALGIDPTRPSLSWGAGFVGPSGVGDLDLDGLERLTTGRRISLNFGMDENAFSLSAATSPEDFPDQMRLLTAKLIAPRWDPALFRRFSTAALQNYDLQFTSAAGRGGRELPSLIRPGDGRWLPVERQALEATPAEAWQAFFAPRLAEGPVHAVIVGDITLDRAVEAMRRTVAALPARTTPAAPSSPLAVRPPAPNPVSAHFTHNGDPAQAYAAIGWSTFGGTNRTKERRALALAGNILQVRLFDQLREGAGASYSPAAASVGSEAFPNWGVFYAASELRPDRVADFLRIARAIVADMAAHPVQADEFTRAQNPVVSGIERRVETNAYWLDAIEDFATDPSQIPNIRSYLADYRGLTPEDVRRAVATYVADQGDWSMVVLPARTAPAAATAPAATPVSAPPHAAPSTRR